MSNEEMKNNRYIYSGYSDYLDQETNEIRPDFVDRMNEQDKEIKTLRKALELACEMIEREICCRDDNDELFTIEIKEDFNNFIEQAKEIINSENKGRN